MLLVATSRAIRPIPLDDLALSAGVPEGFTLGRRWVNTEELIATALRAIDTRLARLPGPRRNRLVARIGRHLRRLGRRLPTVPLVLRVEEIHAEYRSVLVRRLASSKLLVLVQDCDGRLLHARVKASRRHRELWIDGLLEQMPRYDGPEDPLALCDAERAPMELLTTPVPEALRQLPSGLANEGPDIAALVDEFLLRPYEQTCEDAIAEFVGLAPVALRHATTKTPTLAVGTLANLYRGAQTARQLEYRDQAYDLFLAVEAAVLAKGDRAMQHGEVVLQIGSWRQAGRRGMPAFFAAVDRGEPVIDAVAEAAGLPRWAIKATLRAEVIGVFQVVDGDLDLLARLLAYLGPDRMPREFGDWFALGDAFQGGCMARAMLESIRRHGYAPMRRVHDVTGRLLYDYREWLSDVATAQGHADCDLDDWLGRPTLREWTDLANAWQRAQRSAPRYLETQQDRWPPLFPGSVRIGPYTAACLSTPQELREEGLVMGHCVGGYTAHCLTGMAHVVSIRKKGERVGTVSFMLDRPPEGRARVTLAEYSGKNNTQAGAHLRRIANALTRRINTGSLALSDEIDAFEYPSQVYDFLDHSRFSEIAGRDWAAAAELYRGALQPRGRRSKLWEYLQEATRGGSQSSEVGSSKRCDVQGAGSIETSGRSSIGGRT